MGRDSPRVSFASSGDAQFSGFQCFGRVDHGTVQLDDLLTDPPAVIPTLLPFSWPTITGDAPTPPCSRIRKVL